MEEEIRKKIEEFERENRKSIEKVWESHKKFLKQFPFREHPENIDMLTPEKIYNPGDKNTFIYWIEFGLKELGHIRAGSALYAENAKNNPETFKELLRKAVDDNLSISQKN